MTLLYTLLVPIALAAAPAEPVLPSGYYLQEIGDYIMQVNVKSKNSCDIEFGAKNTGSVFVIPDSPFLIEDSGRIVLFPTDPSPHPVFEAMKIALSLPIKFPAYGQWHPSENRIAMQFNIDWNLHHMDAPIKLLDVIKPSDKDGGIFFFGVLYGTDKAEVKMAATEAPKAADGKTAAKSFSIHSILMASLLSGLTLII